MVLKGLTNYLIKYYFFSRYTKALLLHCCCDVCFKKSMNASKPSEHAPSVEKMSKLLKDLGGNIS